MKRDIIHSDSAFLTTGRIVLPGDRDTGLSAPMGAPETGRKIDGDRRCHPRYRPVTGAFALLRAANARIRRIHTLSMADIALAVFRTNPAKHGQIADISNSGLAFTYVADDRCHKDRCVLDILIAESGFYLQGIRFDIVSDASLIDDMDFDCVKTGRLSLRFLNLTTSQTDQILYFLEHHTVDRA